jgi:hypothetical protein
MRFILLIVSISVLTATAAWAVDIGAASSFSVARMVVLLEDGSGGIAPAQAIEFNTGFTLSAFFGWVAVWFRTCLEALR